MSFLFSGLPAYSGDGAYTADQDRAVLGAMGARRAGVRFAGSSAITGDFAVTSNGSTNPATVNVAGGDALISDGAHGFYHVISDGTVASPGVTANNGSGAVDRTDLVVLRVTDPNSPTPIVGIVVKAGSGSVAPTPQNGSGVFELSLATIAVPTGFDPTTTSINSSWITDARTRAFVPNASTTDPTTQIATPHHGDLAYKDQATGLEVYDEVAAAWVSPNNVAFQDVSSPTWTNLTLGSGSSVTYRYARNGNIVQGWLVVNVGTNPTFTSSQVQLSLPPVTPRTGFNAEFHASIYQNGVYWVGEVAVDTSGLKFRYLNVTGSMVTRQPLNNTFPFNGTTSGGAHTDDNFQFTATFWYETA